jgi:hypothetical protein
LYKPGPGLPDNIIALIKPIYARLSTDDLFKKCLDCKTQNQNESINAMIWNKLPKVTFVSSDVLESMMQWLTSTWVLEQLQRQFKNWAPGYYFQKGTRKDNEQRVAKADHRTKAVVKKQRKVLCGQKKKKEDKTKEKEGNTYEAGAF